MRVDEARAALERAGYVVVETTLQPGVDGIRFEVGELGDDVTEAQLVKLAHRHGRWGHAVVGSHSAGAQRR